MTFPIAPERGPERQQGTQNVDQWGCLESTTSAYLGFQVSQDILKYIQTLVNAASQRIYEIRGTDGVINFNWLEQLKSYSEAQPAGDYVYCLLRDPPGATCDPNDAGTQGGKGLLDQLAKAGATALANRGDLAKLTLTPGLAAAYASTSGSNRFGDVHFSACDRVAAREAYLDQRLANLTLKYPASLPKGDFPKGSEFLWWKLWGIDFYINISGQQILNDFYVDKSLIHVGVDLAGVFAKGSVATWAGGTLYATIGATLFACIFVPAACVTLASLDAVMWILAHDIGPFEMRFNETHIGVDLHFLEDPGDHMIKPKVDVTILERPKVYFGSWLPTFVHQFKDLIISSLLTATDDVRDALRDQIKDALQGVVDDFDMQFPFQPFHVFPGVYRPENTSSSGVNGEYLDMVSQLSVPLSGPQFTQADDNVSNRLRELAWTVSARNVRSGGFTISQNMLNVMLTMHHDQRHFDIPIDKPDVVKLAAAIRTACPTCDPGENVAASIFTASTPRLLLTASGMSATPAEYAVTFFDDVRICVRSEKSTIEFRLSARASTQVGFGNATGEHLDVLNASNPFCDLYYDLTAGPVLTEPHVQSITAVGASVADLEAKADTALPQLQDAFRDVVRIMLRFYDGRPHRDELIPRRSGDPITVQAQDLGGKNYFWSQFVVKGANLFVLQGLVGDVTNIGSRLLSGCATARDDLTKK
jgi:hypothetical protein